MRRHSSSLFLAVLFLPAALSLAQTTGDISGRVTDEQGGALPGVAVEARSPSLQGARTTVTDAGGGYRLLVLPPGSYKVSATLQGFARSEVTVTVGLGKTATGDFRLHPALKEEVVVSAQAPLVDESSSAIGNNIDSQQMKSLPTGRNYTSIVQIAPGVTTQNANTSAFANSIVINGSTGLENSFVIDGVVTSGVEYGAQGKELNYEFIQELDVKTGGYQAEFGRSTGGIINVITKSGGNEYHGEVFTYYSNNSVQASNKHPEDSELYSFVSGYNRLDYGFALGGFAVKDNLWFFGAYNRVQNTTKQTLTTGPNIGEPANTDTTKNLGSAKLTWMLNASNTLIGSYFQDPQDSTGAVNDGSHPPNGPFTTFIGLQQFGGSDYSLRYNGLIGSSWVIAAQGAVHNEKNTVFPGLPGGSDIQYIDTVNADQRSGGFGLIQDKTFKRYLATASVTKYLASHELKGGFEFMEDNADVFKYMSGGQNGTPYGQQVTILPGNATNPLVYQHFYWTTVGATVANAPTSALITDPFHRTFSFYLQDTWNVLPNLTVNLGIRWDNQQIFDREGVRQINLTDSWAPRFGFTWDPTRDNKTKVFGSFGYFYEQIPMDLVIRSYSSERQAVIYNFDPVSTVPDVNAALACCTKSDPNAVTNGGGKILGTLNDLTDANLKGQYVREGIVGVERQIFPNVAVGARYIYRDLPQVVEDYLCLDDGTYCVGNPTQGRMKYLYSLDYASQFLAPRAQRYYRGFQLEVNKQFSDNWSLLASYVYSTLQGNFDGLFTPYTQTLGTADPNISAVYDYYDFFTKGPVKNGVPYPQTANGYLSNDRRSVIKLSGLYVTPFNLSVGLIGYYQTGTPISRLGYSAAYSRFEYFLSPRGTDGRVPASYDADLHLGYPLRLGPVTLTLLADIFNILNTQRVIAVDQRYNLSEFNDPNYRCGSQPGGPGGNPDQDACNATFGQPIARSLPTSVRFALKLGF